MYHQLDRESDISKVSDTYIRIRRQYLAFLAMKHPRICKLRADRHILTFNEPLKSGSNVLDIEQMLKLLSDKGGFENVSRL